MVPRISPSTIALILVVLLCSGVGCTRSKYRAAADKRSYELIASRLRDPRWMLPSRAVEPANESRMGLPSNLDCAPKPPDDAASSRWMYCPDGHANKKYWSKIPDTHSIESPVWLDHLPRNEEGTVPLSQELAIQLALLHSRDYQTQFENVYLSALALTGNQFEFETQWNGGLGQDYVATGNDLGGNRLLQVSNRLGLGRNLVGGGQVATNVLNSFFWDFGTNRVGSNGLFVTTFTQPLLRGAFRHVRLETLTQAERNLLYDVRNFARFRRQFYLDISSRYLRLLTQKQSIRNAQVNVNSLRLNLIEHQEMRALKMVSQIQVDQIFQEYQNGRLILLAAEQDLIAALDDFKFQIGLPSWVPFEMDERLLDPFELVAPELVQLQDDAQVLYNDLLIYTPTDGMEFEIAPYETLLRGFERYQKLHDATAVLLPQVSDDFQKWKQLLDERDQKTLSENDRIDHLQQRELARRIESTLQELKQGLEKREKFDQDVLRKIQAYHSPPPNQPDTAPAIPQDTPVRPEVAAWRSLYTAVSGPLSEEVSSLYIAQTQIRLFLIEVAPIEVEQKAAVTFAHQNRLDQMNRQAQVMDAFRKIEVAADALQSQLNVNGQIGIGTDPNRNNAYRLDSSANTYRVGVQFDGPLNRLNERNAYRASQIAYQQAARSYTAGKDVIANEVRAALRQIELRRLNFQIARQQLVAASRQVDQAQINLRTAAQSSTNLTRDLLQSLQELLAAKNNLISNWIDYKINKIRIYTILELLYLDENGTWVNEEFELEQLKDLISGDDYFPPEITIPPETENDTEGETETNSQTTSTDPSKSSDSP